MNTVFTIVLILFFQLSIIVHLQNMIGYIAKKEVKYFNGFMITAVTNIVVATLLAINIKVYPGVLQKLPMELMLLLESGLIFFYLLILKIRITIRIVKRHRDPSRYHLSYFGKKVYDTSIVTYGELITYFVTMPFTIIAGAYFIAKVFL